jgi:hypothetical protein
MKMVRQLIDRFGGILAEKDDVRRKVGADKSSGDSVSLVEDIRRDYGFEAVSAVNARVPGHEILDTAEHGSERGRACGVIEEHIALRPAIQKLDFSLEAYNVAS